MKLLCGAVRFDGRRLAGDLLERMTAALMTSRRPYTLRCWTSPDAMLASLAFVEDARTRHGALRLRDSGAVLAGDVRLDEPEEMQDLLDCEASSDEDLVGCTLDRLGVAGLRSAWGDFAIANWNSRKRELTLARDAMGVRPLVYHSVPGKCVVFASFPRALHASGLVARALDPFALVREMVGTSVAGETLFQGVFSVKPGTHVTFSSNRRTESRYWQPALRTHAFRTPEAGAEALRAAVCSAVRSRVRSADPIATHLSGGLDSSAIAVLAARTLRDCGRSLHAYQFVDTSPNRTGEDSERPYILAVLQQEPSIRWHPVLQQAASRRSGLWKDRVLSASISDPENAACAHAASQGVHLMLSGWGGDEAATFNGRGALANALLSAHWGYFGREYNHLRRRRSFTHRAMLQGELLPYLKQTARAVLRFPSARDAMPATLLKLLRPEVTARVLPFATSVPLIASSVRQNQLNLISGQHVSFRTENWAEIGAHYGIAFAFPLLDRRVIECALSMPGSWYLRDGWKRWPFRDAMQGILPELIRRRHDKLTAFPESFARLADQRDDLHADLQDMLHRPAFRAIFSGHAVQNFLRAFPSAQDLQDEPAEVLRLLPFLAMIPYGQFLVREQAVASPEQETVEATSMRARHA